MIAKNFLLKKVPIISPSDSVAYARNELIRHKTSSVVVMENERIVGVFSEKDLARGIFLARDQIDSDLVKNHLNKKFVLVSPDATMKDIAALMIARSTPFVLVFKDELLGRITKTDVAKYFSMVCSGQARVSDVMKTDVVSVSPNHSLFRALREMTEHKLSHLVVKDLDSLGVIAARDIALFSFGMHPTKQRMSREGKEVVKILPASVSNVMKTDIISISPKSDLSKAAGLMIDKNVGCLLVMDDHKLVGVITKTDLVRFLAEN